MFSYVCVGAGGSVQSLVVPVVSSGDVLLVPPLSQVSADEGKGQQEDPQELPIPEQFISSFQAGKLVTVAASHSGA